MRRPIHSPKNQNFEKMVGLKVHSNLNYFCELFPLFRKLWLKTTTFSDGAVPNNYHYECLIFV